MKARGNSQHCVYVAWWLVHICNPSTQETEARGPGVQGQPQLWSDCKASLIYVSGKIKWTRFRVLYTGMEENSLSHFQIIIVIHQNYRLTIVLICPRWDTKISHGGCSNFKRKKITEMLPILSAIFFTIYSESFHPVFHFIRHKPHINSGLETTLPPSPFFLHLHRLSPNLFNVYKRVIAALALTMTPSFKISSICSVALKC